MFLDLGYQVYVVDQTSVGRGTQQDFTGYPSRIGSTSSISEVPLYLQSILSRNIDLLTPI